jgi:hypothetical protein
MSFNVSCGAEGAAALGSAAAGAANAVGVIAMAHSNESAAHAASNCFSDGTIDARIPARASAAHNTLFMSESPLSEQETPRNADSDGKYRLICITPRLLVVP